MATHHGLTAQAEPVAHEDVVTSYKEAPTRTVSAGGVNFAYRELGPKTGVPVIFLTHLAAVLDNWDPRVVDGIAAQHRVIAFDNRGVGASTENARRCTMLGVARVVEKGTLRPATARAAVLEVLRDPAYRRNAQRLRAEIDALPGPEQAVARLEALVGSSSK